MVPVAFVAYFYGQERMLDKETHRELSLVLLSLCFLVGGAAGIIVAGILEYETLRNLGILGLFGVGVIEEGVKLIFTIAIHTCTLPF